MQNQMTNISCIAGLIIIFVMAAFFQTHFRWVAGVVVLLLIFIIRSQLGEITRKTELIMTVSSWCCILITILFLF